MSAGSDARDRLLAGLRAVPKVRVGTDLGAVDPPALVVGPPRLTPEAYGPALSTASFVVALVAPANDRALDVLLDLVQPVSDAVWDVDGAVVTDCTPGTWPVGAQSLPAYLIDVEMSL